MRCTDEKQRVVITGMGIVCPLGNDVETLWQGLLAGKSGMDYNTIFDASTFPTTFDAEVKDYDLAKSVQKTHLHTHASRGTRFVVGATAQACRQAHIDIETPTKKLFQNCHPERSEGSGLRKREILRYAQNDNMPFEIVSNPSDGIPRDRLGIYLGAGEGSVDNEVFFAAIADGWDTQKNQMDWGNWAKAFFGRSQPSHELEQESNLAAAHVAMLTGARGPSLACLTACAASTQATGEATMLIRHGQADAMIAGGCHSMIHPLGLTGFNRLTALSTRNASPQTASRPFSASRDGFVLGEGAAIVILESLSSAKRRDIEILAEVVGYGSSADAFRVTDMHEEGRGAIQAIEAALKDAGLSYRDVDYINAHGTSTMENDSVETKAIKAVFKERARHIPISSTKSMFGHLIGAAGAAELITCVLAIRNGTIPPTINLNDPDPALDLDYVPNKPRRATVNVALNESFGFGGQNDVVIIRKYQN